MVPRKAGLMMPGVAVTRLVVVTCCVIGVNSTPRPQQAGLLPW